MTRTELIGKINELAENLPRAREDVAARLHALARIDRRDTADVDAILERVFHGVGSIVGVGAGRHRESTLEAS